MRGAASRRASRRGQPRLIAGGSAVAPDFCRNIDTGAFAADLARALARGRVFADPAVAVGALLADALPALQAEFALALDASGRVVASAADGGGAVSPDEAEALLRAGRAVLAGGERPSDDEAVAALPLATERGVVGALALKSPCPLDRPGFAASVDLLARCVADMEAMAENRAPQRPLPAAPERQGVADRLIEALASHGDGVALFGPDRGLVAANAAFTAAHGATVRDLKGLTLEEILRRGHDGLSPLWIGRDLAAEDGAAGADMALAADGRWLRLSRRRSPAGDEMVIQTVADDVLGRVADGRRRDRLAARDAAARERIWDGLPVGVILLSRASRILEVNATAAALLRATAADLKGRRLGRLADRLSDRWSIVGRARGGGPLAAKARRLANGEAVLILTELPEDAPPRKSIEQEQGERALAATRALGELGHEMRTPLNAVIGFADVMLARSFGPVNERQAQYLQDIANAGRHMLDMVDHMLDHAQLTAGAYPIQPEWCLLRAIATEAVRLLAPAASAGEVDLVLEPLPDLEVYVDRRSLLQVLINLLGNAVKFTPAGGRVALSAERASDALHIVVADTGEGIAEADLDRVREPFTQARRLGGRPLKGAGLGLAIVSAIAELHESEVTIASTLGDGARVTFKLPLSRTRPHAGDAR